jgi:general secretion pathway protein D
MEAEVSFGEEIPVLETTTDSDGDDTYTYDYRDATITLKVTPVIDDNNLVTLDLEQTFREVDPEYEATASGDDYVAPSFTTRSLTSNLQVEDGQTLVLGGLIKRSDQVVKSGIPILSQLPLIGWLFGSTSTDRIGTEILIIITPHVVNTREETDLMTAAYRRKVFGSLDVADVRKLYDLDDDDEDEAEEEVAEPAEAE